MRHRFGPNGGRIGVMAKRRGGAAVYMWRASARKWRMVAHRGARGNSSRGSEIGRKRALTAAMVFRCGGRAGTRCAALPSARNRASWPGSATVFSARRIGAILHFFLWAGRITSARTLAASPARNRPGDQRPRAGGSCPQPGRVCRRELRQVAPNLPPPGRPRRRRPPTGRTRESAPWQALGSRRPRRTRPSAPDRDRPGTRAPRVAGLDCAPRPGTRWSSKEDDARDQVAHPGLRPKPERDPDHGRARAGASGRCRCRARRSATIDRGPPARMGRSRGFEPVRARASPDRRRRRALREGDRAPSGRAGRTWAAGVRDQEEGWTGPKIRLCAVVECVTVAARRQTAMILAGRPALPCREGMPRRRPQGNQAGRHRCTGSSWPPAPRR
jgi:hypothetical protein